MRGPKVSGRAVKSRHSVILSMWGLSGFRNLTQSLASPSALATSVDSLLENYRIRLLKQMSLKQVRPAIWRLLLMNAWASNTEVSFFLDSQHN